MVTQDRTLRSIIRLVTAFTSDTADGFGCTYDLSEGGCRIDSETPPPRGTYLSVGIVMPDHGGPLVIPVAVVQWVNGHTFRVEFLQVSPESQRRLRHYLT